MFAQWGWDAEDTVTVGAWLELCTVLFLWLS